MNFNKFVLKKSRCYHFDEIIKFDDFGFDNILTDEKSPENNFNL